MLLKLATRLALTMGLCLLTLAWSGCGFTKAGGAAPAGSAYPVDKTVTYYHAYGDSITFGYALPDRATQVYPALVAAENGYALTNLAISGNQACDVPTLQFIPHGDQPTLAQKGLYSLLISTNDVDVKGTGAYEAVFNLCHQASLAWLALPVEDKVLATDAAVILSGSTHLEADNSWNAATTDARGASLTFPLLLSRVAPLYVWYRIRDGSPGTFTYALDSVVGGSVRSATSPSISTQAGTTDSLALLRLPAVAAGAHRLTFTQTSDGSSGAGIVAVGAPSGEALTTLPLVLVGSTPPQRVQAGGPCSLSTAACQAYADDIAGNVALLQADGLNVQLFDTGKYMSASSVDMLDALHPNPVGDMEIYRALEDVLALH